MTTELKAKTLYTCTQAASFLGTNKVLLSRLIGKGVLIARPNPLDNRTKLIHRTDLERLLETGRPAEQRRTEPPE